MSEVVLITIGAVLANNFVLTKFLGLCPFFGASTRVETALGMSLATTFVLTLSAALGAFVELTLLVPYELTQLRLVALILVIAAVVQLSEMALRATSPLLHRVLGIFLPLITTNCAVLSVALLNVTAERGVLVSAYWGFCTALGFSLVLVLFSAMRERFAHQSLPRLLEGAPIALITAGLMALAFMGFTGMGSTAVAPP
jgi:electron transport complex protein RnfA